ncbi:hypothetical protein VZ95_14755 [Elstera litoralis]|uniref:Uncharacterized protein n=1 Tax=Elstera litoralis TaxID=552518 RepID=A0A0F3IQS5_9PROT|nr:ABC transporter C-terminal domain-containing protein [Elstera litoralis]KJV08908.1 hypothetical protein VZ95_14755 [Elstera litoralis]
MTSISSSPAKAGFASSVAWTASPKSTAADSARWDGAVVVDFSPLAFSTPSPHDSLNGQTVHLGTRPELIAELEATRQSIDEAMAAEQKAKDDVKANKTVKPFTLKELLEKLDEKYDVLSAQRQERRNPDVLSAEQRALLREERLGPLWKKRFSLRW